MRNKISIFIIMLLYLNVNAQIEINNTLKPPLNDSLEISNVGLPNDSTSLVNLKDIRQRTYLFFNLGITNDSIGINIDTNIIPIEKGLMIYVQCTSGNIGSVKMNVNGTIYSITKNNRNKLDSADILPGKILVLICNDTSFQLLNPERPTCPPGFAQVNENYCIEIDERYGNFWIAASTCGKYNYRMCSWSEWYYACHHRNNLGLNDMIDNWEWVNQGQNEENNGKRVGLTTCEVTYHGSLAGHIGYRCCFNY